MVRSPLVVLACVGCAVSASAQCTIGIANVPDLDQRRNTLPGNGDMYCAPTSVTNWAAYIANHGLPSAMSGPRNFQDQSNYAYETSVLSLMGSLMGTDPVAGTSGGMLPGASLYFLANTFGKVSVTEQWVGNGQSVAPFDMFFHMTLGGMVSMCYGYYDFFGGIYNRTGGHCVTLTNDVNACAFEPVLWFRNPATDTNYNTQSGFVSTSTRVRLEFPTTVQFGPIGLWRMEDLGVGSTTARYLDSMLVVHPNFALTKDPAGSGFTIFRPIPIGVNLLPTVQHVLSPNGRPIRALTLSPDLLHAVLITEPPAVGGGSATTYLYGLADGSVRTLIGLLNPVPHAAFTRFGDLVVCDGSVRVYDVRGPEGVLKHSATPTSPVGALDYDDATDQIVAFEPNNRQFVLYDKTLTTGLPKPLPTSIPAGTGPFFAIGDTPGQYFLGFAGNPNIYETMLATDGSGRLALRQTIALPAVQMPQALRFTNEGTLLVVNNGLTVELQKSARTGTWGVRGGSDFDGLPAGSSFVITRNRTNFDPALHTGPGWRNVLHPEDSGGEFVECPCVADFDASGGTPDGSDIAAFFAAWLRGDPAADADCSGGTPDSTDINVFFTQWLAGGC